MIKHRNHHQAKLTIMAARGTDARTVWHRNKAERPFAWLECARCECSYRKADHPTSLCEDCAADDLMWDQGVVS